MILVIIDGIQHLHISNIKMKGYNFVFMILYHHFNDIAIIDGIKWLYDVKLNIKKFAMGTKSLRIEF